MAIRTKEELLSSINTHIGDDASDDVLSLIEDTTDTMNDFENKSKNNGENWEQKYRENDAAWRKKYRDRFFGGNDSDNDEPEIDTKKDKPLTFENLFKEG